MKKAYYRQIPAYFNESTNELEGRNWFYGILIDLNLWFDTYIVEVNEYPIWIEED